MHQQAQERETPPLGRLLEVGGRRLLVHCSGNGGPAVVFAAGASAIGLDYLNVHDRITGFTTSVLYDRGGTGWSDPAPLPRTGTEGAEELGAMLRAAGVPAPYLLVGHSLGGIYVRRFAQLHPDEVAALLLLEPAHEDWDAYMPEHLRMRGHVGAEAPPMPEVTGELLRQFRAMLEQMFAGWPDAVREALIERHLDPGWLQANALERSNMIEVLDELRDGGTPDVPLIVITGMRIDPGQAVFLSEDQLREQNEAKLALYEAVAASVPRGEHRVLENASHSLLHIEGQDAVVQAIRDLVDRAGANR
ncbi:MAG TPA: alpha/beta hydrolase [Micromonosporaceae bacterium]|nr:alpha/beta hydrolase [Micromonosporaceae bacterium]